MSQLLFMLPWTLDLTLWCTAGPVTHHLWKGALSAGSLSSLLWLPSKFYFKENETFQDLLQSTAKKKILFNFHFRANVTLLGFGQISKQPQCPQPFKLFSQQLSEELKCKVPALELLYFVIHPFWVTNKWIVMQLPVSDLKSHLLEVNFWQELVALLCFDTFFEGADALE